MRPNHILLLIFVTLLFAGSASSSVYDLPAYQEASVSTVVFDCNDGDDDSTGVPLRQSISARAPRCPLVIGKAFAGPVQWKRARITIFPLTPQAPPA